MQEAISVLKALADENRLRALLALQQRELCVCQITALLELAPSTVSEHMSILKQAGLVTSRKDGRWIYYRAADWGCGCAQSVAACLATLLRDDATVAADGKRMDCILAQDPEELCRRQCNR